jgi:hypothetical protein
MLAVSALTFLRVTPSACGLETTASGQKVRVDIVAKASKESESFTNAAGWNVRISKALATTGPLYFYDSAVPFAQRPPTPSRQEFFSLRSAFAHPGHGSSGSAVAELLTFSSVDLVVGGTLGTAQVVTGTIRSAAFSFSAPARGSLAKELGDRAVVLEGTAEKDTARQAFRFDIQLDELGGVGGEATISGCPFEEARVATNGVIELEVKIPLWFDQVDFTNIPSPTEQVPDTTESKRARNQLIRGMKAGLGYTFSFTPKANP